jgi:formylglycine-generating enzyme required for sulfatase activity
MDKAKIEPSPQIAGYDITRRLGRGGMADVYLATQVSLGRPVAIKVLSTERTAGEETVTRFEQEARTIARLDHPNIVSIFDVGRTEDGRLYYVMPYLPNGDLSTRDLREDEKEIVAIVRSLARALGYAHKHGVVHRDVKPENVLFDKLDRPLLADFGIALASSDFARVTREGSTIGSSGYMSPEQARGFSIDGRADLYSLGVVTYEMVSGDLPYHGPDTLSVALAHVEQPIPRLSPRRRRWQPFIDKAMAKSPEERFQSAEQMEGALDAIAEQVGDKPDEAYATKLLPTLNAAPRGARIRSGVALAVVLSVAGAVLIGYALMRLRHAPTAIQETAAATAVPPASEQVPAAQAPGADAPTPAAIAPDANAAPEPTAAIPAAADAPSDPPQNSGAEGAAAQASQSASPEAAAKPPDAPKAPKPKPAKPAKPSVSDLATGAALRDSGGPELSFVSAELARDGQRFDVGHAFALGRFEVTRREYAAFASATGRAAAKCREPHSPLSLLRKLSWREPGFDQDDSHPVVCVSWDDANAYAQWLSTRTHARYRLPTHAEWAHATHWNSSKGQACELGNMADAPARRGEAAPCSDGYANTAPVGKFKPNQLGIRDLVGNVSEWTRDCKNGKADDSSCKDRMFSGSSWRDAPGGAIDVQDDAGVDVGYTTIGFRLLRELDDENIPASVK